MAGMANIGEVAIKLMEQGLAADAEVPGNKKDK